VLTLRTWREEFPDATVRLTADATPVVGSVRLPPSPTLRRTAVALAEADHQDGGARA